MTSYITMIPRSEQLAALAAKKKRTETPEQKAARAKRARVREKTPAVRAKRNERLRARTVTRREQKLENIAILDMETDPFDNEDIAMVRPFLAVIWRSDYDPIVIWQDYPIRTEFVPPPYKRMKANGHRTDAQWEKYHAAKSKHEKHYQSLETASYKCFCHRVRTAIEELPGQYTVYAHNGGKFDFMFLLPELRGSVLFKGRGIMRATIGRHELRDSFNIIPASLKTANRKDDIDYSLMKRENRDAARPVIIKYCISDCSNLHELVHHFVDNYGFKLSIGQAAMKNLKESYDTKNIGGYIDALLRTYYHGGRVECLQGAGLFVGDYRLYDVNSMYPAVMRDYKHPIGNGGDYFFRSSEPQLNEHTCFITLECDNRGALLGYDGENTLTSGIGHGIFHTTIHEYRTALRLDLISNVRLIKTIDCSLQTTFENFIDPLYAQRRELIEQRDAWQGSREVPGFYAVERDILFLKFLMNNAYGKFAQDPSRFKEWFITDPNETVPTDEKPRPEAASDYYDAELPDEAHFRCTKRPQRPDVWEANINHADYTMWSRPTINTRGGGFYNVGTAASITGAARAVLMEAIHNADDAIYCDTDSVVCRGLRNTGIDSSKLGAWKLEGQFCEAYLAGKKSYGLVREDGTSKVRHKGGSVSLAEMQAMVLSNAEISTINKGVTIAKDGSQTYITRTARRTAKTHANHQSSDNLHTENVT